MIKILFYIFAYFLILGAQGTVIFFITSHYLYNQNNQLPFSQKEIEELKQFPKHRSVTIDFRNYFNKEISELREKNKELKEDLEEAIVHIAFLEEEVYTDITNRYIHFKSNPNCKIPIKKIKNPKINIRQKPYYSMALEKKKEPRE